MDSPGTSNEHISQLRSSATTSGSLTTETRARAVQNIDYGRETYRSHNDATRAQAAVITRTSARGTRYVTTVADGVETNNLLDLPRF